MKYYIGLRIYQGLGGPENIKYYFIDAVDANNFITLLEKTENLCVARMEEEKGALSENQEAKALKKIFEQLIMELMGGKEVVPHRAMKTS
ncbi:MAG: hypothetical protein HUU56_03685 [Bdellovibrionaceae bacterium]|nr:hypothetical protein [Pseudobdellovibrionaceae bacterium]